MQRKPVRVDGGRYTGYDDGMNGEWIIGKIGELGSGSVSASISDGRVFFGFWLGHFLCLLAR